ncbi:putative gustatory receptor 58a [Ceratitis capitata]|uniref:putative gustatory receptor 58a n=1 Tax=Ceratitis capitata TaxID=7213 RepID=UPI0006187F31|nr:putative gustatory receptor 58a [Ceratitis capitata]
MLRERLHRIVLNVLYYNSLLVGLLPAPLDRGTQAFRSSRFYLIHTVFAHSFCVLVTTYAGYYYYNHGFLTRDPVLQWTYSVTYLTKNLLVVVLVKELWCKRKRTMAVYLDYWLQEMGLEASLAAIAGLNEEVTGNQTPLQHNRDPQRHIENLIIFKFFLAYSLVVMNAYYFLNQHPGTDATYLPITCISFGLNTFVLTLSGLFYCVLSQLYRQFSQINIQLCLVLEQLRRQSSEAAEVQTALASRINSLGMLHLAGYRLTQEIFAIGELTLAALLLRLLAANMRTVYGACYFLSKRETENLWSQAEEILFTTLFFSDTAMVMSMLNAVLSECNGAGKLLREYTEFMDVKGCDCLRKALDAFSTHLGCHKLRYMVCGLFEFNKMASLQFFLTILVKVTVLVQFDMQNKLRNNRNDINVV